MGLIYTFTATILAGVSELALNGTNIHIYCYHPGRDVQIAPGLSLNGAILGLLNIRFQYILAMGLILKSQNSHILANSGPFWGEL